MNNEAIYEKAKTVFHEYKSSKELKKYIAIKTVISVLLTIFWYVLWITSTIRYFSNSWATFNPKNVLVYIAGIAIIIAPFYLFKPQKWFGHKPYLGKITFCESRNIRVDRATSTSILHLSAESLDNKTKKHIKVKMFPGIENHYHTGNSFVYLRGIDYPIVLDSSLDESQSEQTLCHICGHFNSKRCDRCFNCSNVLWSKNLL